MIVHGMPEAEYHAHPAISSSLVKRVDQQTPAHVLQYLRTPPNDTPATQLGSVTHAAILETDAIEARYVVLEKPNLRTKAGREKWQQMHEEAAENGLTVVAQEEFDKARRMRDSVHAHPEARLVLAKGRPEVSIFATDPETGCELRSREDWSPEGFDVIVDLKTCRDASPRWFPRDAFRLGYPISAWHYRTVRQIVTSQECDFMWIAVESDAPHAVACYYAEGDVLAWAAQRWRAAVRTLQQCAWSGQWPAYPDQSTPLPLPAWAARELEESPL